MARFIVFLCVVAFNVTLGAMAVNYDIWALFGKHVPLVAAIVGGLFLGQIVVPLAIVLWLLHFVVTFPIIR